MVQQKAAAFVFSSSFILSLFFYNYYLLRADVKSRREVIREPIYLYTGSEDFLINTTGCVIPNYGKNFKFHPIKDLKQSCGKRAIFVQKIANNSIVFKIDNNTMQKYIKKNEKYTCCYKFASRSKTTGEEDISLSYTSCKPFNSGTTTYLLEEVITVTCESLTNTKKCSQKNKECHTIYEDAYIVIKKIQTNKSNQTKKKWNVLLLGMDTMSRARIFSTMPKTAKYLQNNGWLDYKGYQKVGSNTFPNVMSFLTGMNLSSIYNVCQPNMYSCNEHMVWSKFRTAGYATAYGEDWLQLPDTFFRYNGFQIMPTQHYMRPLFLTGEWQRGNTVCTKQLPSGKHILDYAYDFADTYQKEGFFGLFWINSYSHNKENLPSLFETDILKFFENANATGFMNNTFIVFFSDHGIRTGPDRLPVASYHEERLPMFFVWVPNQFRIQHEEEYYNLKLNQNRLITPYNLYKTMVKISNMSVNSVDITSEACPSCKILFEEISPHTTCSEVGVNEKWCSCHDMIYTNRTTDKDAMRSLQVAVSYVQSKAEKVKTVNCMKCHTQQLDKVIRIHSFIKGIKKFYVVVFEMSPGNVVYEATILKDNNTFKLVNGAETLTVYNTRGNCVINPLDRVFCVCKKIKCSK